MYIIGIIITFILSFILGIWVTYKYLEYVLTSHELEINQNKKRKRLGLVERLKLFMDDED
jgi:uncharacterized protein YneF (UPF0154 family)